MSRFEEAEYFAAMRIDRAEMPAASPHDMVMRLALSRYGETVSPDDVYSVSAGDKIFDWLTTMYGEGKYGLVKLPPNTTLIVSALDNDPTKSERIGARILVTGRFGEYPTFFAQGRETHVLLIQDNSVASTFNVWTRSTASVTLDTVGNFEPDDDNRFEVEPYSGSSYAEVPADSVLYIDFTGPDSNMGIVPVSKELIQHFLSSPNPKFPVSNQPVERDSALYQRFSRWVDRAVGGDAMPFRFTPPVVASYAYDATQHADLQQRSVAYMINERGYTEDDLIDAGVSREAVLLYLVNVYAHDRVAAKRVRPVRLVNDGAVLSLRSVSRFNLGAYQRILRAANGHLIPPIFRAWPAPINADDARFESARVAFGDNATLETIRTYLLSEESQFRFAAEYIAAGVNIENHMRELLRLEVMGFKMAALIVSGLVDRGARITLDAPGDVDLVPAYGAHCKAVPLSAQSTLAEVRLHLPEELVSPSVQQTEEFLCIVRELDYSVLHALLVERKLSMSMALAIALRYATEAVATRATPAALFAEGYLPDERLLALLDPESPGRAILAELMEERERQDSTARLPRSNVEISEAVRLVRSMQSSAADRMTRPFYYLVNTAMRDFFFRCVEGGVVSEYMIADAPSLNFHFGADGATILIRLATSASNNKERNTVLLLQHGANPWGATEDGVSFADIVCERPNDFLYALDCMMEMHAATVELRRQIEEGRDLDPEALGIADFWGLYSQPPLIFTAIQSGNRRALEAVIAEGGETVRYNSATPLTFAKQLRSPLTSLLEQTLTVRDAHLFRQAARAGRAKAVARYLWRGMEPNREGFLRDLPDNDEYMVGLFAEAGVFRFDADFEQNPLIHVIARYTSAKLVATLVENGCNPFALVRDATTPAAEATTYETRGEIVDYLQRRMRMEMETMERQFIFPLQFDGQRSTPIATLERLTLENLEARLRFWELPSSNLDVYIRAPGNDDLLLRDVDLTAATRRRLHKLGGHLYTEEVYPNAQIGSHRAILQSHYVTPPHVALYKLNFTLNESNLIRNLRNWEKVYPVPYPVLGWISAALHFDPMLARIERETPPQLLFFFARNPAVTAVLTWNMTLIEFAKLYKMAHGRNRVHPALLNTMAWMQHPLRLVNAEASRSIVGRRAAFLTEFEIDLLGELVATDAIYPAETGPGVDFLTGLVHEWQETIEDGIAEDVIRFANDPENPINVVGNIVRRLLLTPRTDDIRDEAYDLFRLIAHVDNDFFTRQALALLSTGLMNWRHPSVAEWWNIKFARSDDFLSFEHFTAYHDRLLEGVVFGVTAACAIYDMHHMRNAPIFEVYLNNKNVHARFRANLLRYDEPTPSYPNKLIFQRKAEILPSAEDRSITTPPPERDTRYHSPFSEAIDFLPGLPSEGMHVFLREARLERAAELLYYRPGDHEIIKLNGIWLPRFLMMHMRAGYGLGEHLQLTPDQYRDSTASVIYIHKIRRGEVDAAYAAIRDPEIVLDPRASDCLSLFSSIPRVQDTDWALTARTMPSAILSAAVLRGLFMSDPIIDGRPLAYAIAAPYNFGGFAADQLRGLIPMAARALRPHINFEWPEMISARRNVNAVRGLGQQIPPSAREIGDDMLPAQRWDVELD